MLLCTVLAGCGGGGKTSGGASIRAERTLVEVTATSNSDGPIVGVDLIATNPPPDGFFYYEEFSGEGLRQISTQPLSNTRGTLLLQFQVAQELAPGTYVGEARFIACEDEACARPLRGSPLRITTRYTVPASVKPTTAVRFDNPVIEVESLRGSSAFPSARAGFTITGAPNIGLGYRVQPLSTRGIASAGVDTFFDDKKAVDISLRNPDTLDAGLYEDDVLLTVCIDSDCTQQAQGSPARLTVRYRVLATTPPDAPLATLDSARTLPYDVRLAEYSPASDGLAIVSVAQGPRLYFHDVASGRERSVALPADPLSLTLSPDGRSALVGHEGQLSLVTVPADGSALTLRSLRLLLSGRAGEVLLDGQGLAHVFPTSGGGSSDGGVYTLRVNIGLELDNRVSNSNPVESGRARLLPNGSVFYVSEEFGDSGATEAVSRYNVAALTGFVSAVPPVQRGEDFGGCGNLWLDPSLQRLVTACGAVLSVSDTAAQDLRLLGSLLPLPGTRPYSHRFSSMSFGNAGEIAAVETQRGCNPIGRLRCQHHLNTYDASSLVLRLRQSLPNVGAGNAEQPREPLYVFESEGLRQVLSASQQADGPRIYEWLTVPLR